MENKSMYRAVRVFFYIVIAVNVGALLWALWR